MLRFLILLTGLASFLSFVAFLTHLNRAIARRHLASRFGVSARLRLSLTYLFVQLGWIGEHLTEQGRCHLQRAIKFRRLLYYCVAVNLVLQMAESVA